MDIIFWVLIAAGAVAYLMSGGKQKRKQGRYKNKGGDFRGQNRKSHAPAPEIIKEENTAERQLMNKSEYVVFCRLEALLAKTHSSYRVFAQVSLGEILGSDSKPAYWAINSKRADFVIIDRTGQPVAVVEYQGTGHYQGDASVRDAVKREACKSAGIAFIELSAGYSDADISAISQLLRTEAG
ncbi:MAG: DUF2726 domain-containing protein [Mixta calida]|uniref:DUF2726 domain-containing protein n=1 Tax=Mixta calida TaxID=665913 RepID=UPI002901650F|nr:DUF2726 domain-containing protein [Mixta calida]